MEDVFVSYITYSEYTRFGGSLPKDVFTHVERKAQRTLDAITFDRIKHLTTIPDVVKEVLVEFIDLIYKHDKQKGEDGSVYQYSNSVEQIIFKVEDDKEFRKELTNIAVNWLPTYLTNRMVSFDVDKYLQRNCNCIQ